MAWWYNLGYIAGPWLVCYIIYVLVKRQARKYED